MKIIRLHNNQSAVIKAAVRVLRAGGVIVYPTETAYGMGADFFNPKAVRRVYKIKGRSYAKQLSILVGSLVMAKKMVKFNEKANKFAKKYWPGALTLVLEVPNTKLQFPKKFQNSNHKIQTLALRISSNEIATGIVKQFKKPITATSANVSGKSELYSAAAVIKQFSHRKYQPDLIIDAGVLPKRPPSTIVSVVGGRVKVLRQGRIQL